MYHARYDLPRLYNWMDAVAKEKEIVPIRGRTPECKPLGIRRNTHVTIRRKEEVYYCRLNDTDVVAFHRDGRIVINLDGWASQSTVRFIEELLGVHMQLAHNSAWIVATTKDSPQVLGFRPIHASQENVFVRNGSGDLEFQNPLPVFSHRVNRARANIVRARYKSLKDYIVRTLRLRDDGFSFNEFGEMFGWANLALPTRVLPAFPEVLQVSSYQAINKADLQTFLRLASSEENKDQYKACLWLVRSVGSNSKGKFYASLPAMLKGLDEIIMYGHRDEFFSLCENTGDRAGKIYRDPYAKFFSR